MLNSGWIRVVLGLAIGLVSLPVRSAQPDPEALRQLMQQYEQEAESNDQPSRPPTPARPVKPARSRSTETLISGRYRDNGDGTVTDVQTHLRWMRCALGQTWNGGTCAGKAERYEWQAALDAAESFNNQGGYAGYQDWRVPNREELRGLVYCSSGFEIVHQETGARWCKGDNYSHPTIDTTAFPNTPTSYFWSASPLTGNSVYAWDVHFYSGLDNWNGRSNAVHVRLVRAGQ